MGFFRNTNRTGPYFEGWYFKHQSPQGQTLALIPAFHMDRKGRRTASLQVISKNQAWWLEYSEAQLKVSRQPFQVHIGQSSFGSQVINLHIQQDGLSLCGTLHYGPFTVLRSDIMGPFLRRDAVLSWHHQHGTFSEWNAGVERRAPGFLRRNRLYRDGPGPLLSKQVPLDPVPLGWAGSG